MLQKSSRKEFTLPSVCIVMLNITARLVLSRIFIGESKTKAQSALTS